MSIPPTTHQVEQPAIRAIARAAGEDTETRGYHDDHTAGRVDPRAGPGQVVPEAARAARHSAHHDAGLSATSVDGASAFSYPLIFLPFISSAFVVTATMPGPVRAFAEHQPVTPIVNTIRDLYTQQPVDTDIWIALAWCVGILILAYALAMATYRRRIS
jgi:hypothetical protein